eukprot:4464402-Amphidinium_carterae.1
MNSFPNQSKQPGECCCQAPAQVPLQMITSFAPKLQKHVTSSSSAKDTESEHKCTQRARLALRKAIRSRGRLDMERIRAVLEGNVWEGLLEDEGDSAVSSTTPVASSQDEGKPNSDALNSDLKALIRKWAHGSGA